MRRWFAAVMAAAPKPRRSITPGRKFSITTSAPAISCRAVSRSASFFRSRTMLRLLRFQVALAGVFQRGPPGGSTRTTSAPWSPSSMAAMGPAMYWPKSMTRTPSRTPDMLSPLSSDYLRQPAQIPAQDLAHVRLRKRLQEANLLGHLVRGQVAPAMRNDVVRGQRRARRPHHEKPDRLAGFLVRRAHAGALGDARAGRRDRLHLVRIHVEAGDEDDVLLAV